MRFTTLPTSSGSSVAPCRNGWPAHTGGPMYWAGTVGLATIRERLEAFRATHGPHWSPSTLLTDLAGTGKTFTR